MFNSSATLRMSFVCTMLLVVVWFLYFAKIAVAILGVEWEWECVLLLNENSLCACDCMWLWLIVMVITFTTAACRKIFVYENHVAQQDDQKPNNIREIKTRIAEPSNWAEIKRSQMAKRRKKKHKTH